MKDMGVSGEALPFENIEQVSMFNTIVPAKVSTISDERGFGW